MTGSDTDYKDNSDIFKAAKILRTLVTRKHKNKGKDWVLEKEKTYLESVTFQVEGKKRKSFENVQDKSKKKRVKSVIENIEKDPGLEEAVFETLKKRNESEDCDEVSDEFKLATLSLMKKLNLTDRKLDDLRYWIKDMMRRGMDLKNIPSYRKLRNTSIQDMIPDGFSSTSTGASIPIVSHLYHHLRRFLIRPDIICQLEDGEEIVHVAKLGSDYATGHGKMHQRKTEEFDEDGSHNSASGVSILRY